MSAGSAIAGGHPTAGRGVSFAMACTSKTAASDKTILPWNARFLLGPPSNDCFVTATRVEIHPLKVTVGRDRFSGNKTVTLHLSSQDGATMQKFMTAAAVPALQREVTIFGGKVVGSSYSGAPFSGTALEIDLGDDALTQALADLFTT
jgi:hypothetical protein